MISTDTKYLQTAFTTRNNLYSMLSGWGVTTVRGAVDAFDQGSSFALACGLHVVTTRHPRIFGAYAQRRATPMGLSHEVTGGDSGAALRARTGFAAALKQHLDPQLGDIVDGLAGLGFQVLQTTWIASPDASTLDPVTTPWPTSCLYWNPFLQRLEAITAEGGRVPVVDGDGKWTIIGSGQKPWLRGAIRALAEGWAASRYAERDEAALSAYLGRLCPIGIAPQNIQPGTTEGDAFAEAVKGLGDAQSGGIFPFGSEVTTLPNVDAGAAALFAGFLDRRAAGFETVILGASSATTPGVYVSPLIGRVSFSIVRGDTTTISTGLSRIGAVYGAINAGLTPDESPAHRWLLPDPTEADRVKALGEAFVRAAGIVAAERAAGLDMTNERLKIIYASQGIPAQAMPASQAKAPIFAYHITANIVAADQVLETLGLPAMPGGVGSPAALAAHILAVRDAELKAAQGGTLKPAAPAESAPAEG